MEIFTETIGYVAAICTTISFLPQVIKTIKTRKAKDISLFMYILLVIGIILWLTYGFLIKALPIIVANLVTFFLVIIILIMKIKYK